MDDPAFVLRSSRAAYSRNPTTSPVDRSPCLSISTNNSPWFTPGLVPYSRNMQDLMEEEEHPLHTSKDLSDDDPAALCRSRDREGQQRDQYGAPMGWDWRSRKWIDKNHSISIGTQRTLHHRRHQQLDKSADESIDGRISRLRQDANRLVNERRLITRRNPRQSSGWMSELEGISERRRREVYGGETLARTRREKIGGPRSRRKANHHVLDLHNRRKLMRRESQLRRDTGAHRSKAEGEIVSALQLLGESIPSSKSFSLQTLEEYLIERTAARRLHKDANSRLMEAATALQPTNCISSGRNIDRPRRTKQKGSTGVMIKPINDTSLENGVQQPASIIPFDDGQDEDSEAQRSGCGISWRWLNVHHVNKDDSSIPSHAGTGCFPGVSKRRIGRRLLVSQQRKSWDNYNSEGSFTSFNSDSETVPLMTEPEPFHDYTTDDVAGSSVELDRDHFKQLKPKKSSRFKELESLGNGHSFRKSDCESQVGFSARQSFPHRHRSMSQKHRPKSFKDLVGQPMVGQSLSNAVLRGKIAPVYLFQGPRGTGKTSAARIFTAAVNCLSAEELRPCGKCEECSSFDKGKNFDVREVDAAGNNGTESMKLLLKHISLPPSSRYKVFIIDECHLLTADAWNAFLKSLEEPPSYVVFILITTDAEQLPRTALSRCQKFLFSKVKDSDIVSRLQKIAFLERIDVELSALQLIASRADGSLRDAETTLDQISLLGKRATLSVVQELVGMIPEKKLIEFLEVALSPDTSSTVKAIRDFMESGVEALSLISQLATLITDIVAGNNRSAAYRLKRVRKVEDERFRQALKILSDAEKQLRSCTDKTIWLTAAFLQFSQTDPSSVTPNSLGTSIAQSPVNFFDTSEKETVEGDGKWESHSSPQISERAYRGDHKRGHSQSVPYSGPLVGSRVHPCSHSPKPATDVDDVRIMSGASRPPVVPRVFSSGSNNVDHRQAATNSMDSIWRNVLDNSRSNVVKQLLRGEAKLVSLSVTEVLAVAHLEFRHPEHRDLAEKARTSIASAFQEALCCPVDIKITLSLASAQDIAGWELRNPSSLSRTLECQSKLKKVVPLSKGVSKANYIDGHCLLQEQMSRRSGSFRKSSSSKFGVPVASSPRIRLPEPRQPRRSLEVEETSYSQRYNIELSERERSVVPKEKIKEAAGILENKRASAHYGRTTDAMSVQNADDLSRDHGGGDSQSDSSFTKDRNADFGFSPAPTEGDGYGMDFNNDALDSEAQERYGSSFLCWRGSRIHEGKGKHTRLRRKRRGRLLLKLVPCAKGQTRD